MRSHQLIVRGMHACIQARQTLALCHDYTTRVLDNVCLSVWFFFTRIHKTFYVRMAVEKVTDTKDCKCTQSETNDSQTGS